MLMSAWQIPVHVMQALFVPTPTVPTLVPVKTASQEMGHIVKVSNIFYRFFRTFLKSIMGFQRNLLLKSLWDE